MNHPQNAASRNMEEEGAGGTAHQPGLSEEDAFEEFRRQLQEAQAEAENNLDQWRRTLAEFANYKKRIERDNAELQKLAAAELIRNLLPVIDDLDRAFENIPVELTGNGWVNGIALVQSKLKAVLEAEGVEEIPAEGTSFDPAFHEAITHEESRSHQDGQIIGVIRKGYRVGDRVLRPAQVRVAKAPAAH